MGGLFGRICVGDVRLLVSIVSHLQWHLAERLLEDLAALERAPTLDVVLTLNLPEAVGPGSRSWPFRLQIVTNGSAKGFGANHNAAFEKCATGTEAGFFCVLNPDVRVPRDVFSGLLADMDSDPSLAVVAPAIRNSRGETEDSARRLPTPGLILLKALGRAARIDYPVEERLLAPDWIAGMFMLFRTSAYRRVRGFDERFFLYYEDVDICCRLRLDGWKVAVDGREWAVHDAQRTSARNLLYTRHHLHSMLRFFSSPVFRKARRLGLQAQT